MRRVNSEEGRAESAVVGLLVVCLRAARSRGDAPAPSPEIRSLTSAAPPSFFTSTPRRKAVSRPNPTQLGRPITWSALLHCCRAVDRRFELEAQAHQLP